MNPSRIFILRPVATSLLMVAIVLSGILGFNLLPLAALPQVDFPTIQIQTLYPGGSPEVLSQTVTAPLERQLGQMAGLQRMSSISAAGVSIVTLQFGLGLPIDIAEQQVQAAINASGNLLPADLPAPPIYAKVNPADAPVLTLAVTSDTMPLTEVQNIVNSRLALKISQVTGVGLVTLSGGQRPAVRIQADTGALAMNGIGLDNLRSAISGANSSGAKGSFDGPTRAFSINSNDQLLTVRDYQDLIVSYKNGAPVRLADVAEVVQAAENVRLAAWSGLTPAIIVNVQRQPGANVIATVDAIKAQLPALQAALPAGLTLTVLSDRTAGIRSSVAHVEFELCLAVVLVVLVIFAFLRNLRATLIASLAVPISLIGTCGLMYLLGYSLNNLSLMALTIATGIVVDDAIVMMENISRHLEKEPSKKSLGPMEAALKGASQIGFTIISLTVSLIAVLIPLLFMGDVVGRLFREFAVTLAITILMSAVVSLTLVPMMSARMLRPEEPETGFAEKCKVAFDRLIGLYDKCLIWVLNHQRETLWVALFTFALTFVLYAYIPKGLFPIQDTGQLRARVEASPSISFASMAQLQQQVAKVMLADEEVESLSSIVGVDAANNTAINTGALFINLKATRSRDQQATMARLHEAVSASVPGVTLYLQPTQDLTIDSETGPTQYRVSVTGAHEATVNNWANRLTEQLRQTPEISYAVTDAGAMGKALFITIDRDTASRLSITASSIDDALYSAFGQRIVSTIFTDASQYRVILEAKRNDSSGTPGFNVTQILGDLPLRTGNGKTTPLSAIAKIEERPAPLQITHVAQYPAATVGFDPAPGVSLGQAVDAVKQAAEIIQLPASVTLNYLGATSAYEASLSNQLWLIFAALVCVYIVLGVLYESFIHPLTILSTLPSAGVGALLALWISGQGLGVIGIIGIILLIGIVKKNAIMMIDFALDAERNQHKTAREAIYQAALLRFRPILMTTMAALFAAVPLMLGVGEGSELRLPLGLAIFGGLIVSQMLTLFTTPVIYLAFDRLVAKSPKMKGAHDLGEENSHGEESNPTRGIE